MSVLGLENLERIANEHVQSEKVEGIVSKKNNGYHGEMRY